ncbi:FAD-dependent oxidoreductase [Cellulosimicrobium marinum]|uniref:FAD-dependent oxidoreductase n=1 Tax=Cellulosimicrobium marinum TaxID=1638992 RepID=UPI001E4B3DEA|nr:FAD-binding protein [Cellulosimicrobium marinum]MCB7135645.1 FAD-binding protein [Cellulosimicrobium marinum]
MTPPTGVPAHPAAAEPRTADPRTADPRTAEPRTADPRTADPRPTRASRPRAVVPRAPRPEVRTDDADRLVLAADVLVLGGGPAGTWAAIAATEAGARVVLADKGWCGTSGVAATAGVAHWLVPPDRATRDAEIGVREAQGGHLTDRAWTDAVLDETWARTDLVDGWGYRPAAPPPPRAAGPDRRTFAGTAPDYLRFLRGRTRRGGATILDHSPALELLVDAAGRVSGARGHQRQLGRPWTVTAGAVVLATGGTTWKSRSLGGDVDTGEGHLMAAEVGAHLSSMEFSNFYGMVPLGTSMDKNGFLVAASYWDHTGRPLTYRNLHVSRTELLSASLRGTVTARLTQFPPTARPAARAAMPNFFMVTDKLGVDPFTERFPVDWVQEGTVRGTGGLHLLDRDAWTGVTGLYAAGDVAARDRVVGAATGAGGPNLAWAVASGTWAGRAAAVHAGGRAPDDVAHLAGSGDRGLVGGPVPRRPGPAGSWREVVAAVQGEMHPVEKAAFRSADGLAVSATVLDALWEQPDLLRPAPGADAAEEIRTREAAGMLATARWVVRAAARRTETRGMHTRVDHPDTDPLQAHRLLVGGLDETWVEVDPDRPAPTPEETW